MHMLICILVRGGVKAGEQHGGGVVWIHVVGTVGTPLWAERGSPLLTPILILLVLPPRPHGPPWTTENQMW